MSDERTNHVTLNLVTNYAFVASFDDVDGRPVMLLDEPSPLGGNTGPNAAAVLGAAVGNCLAASLTYCLRKTHVEVENLIAHVTTHVTRNERGRFRLTGLDVELETDLPEIEKPRLSRCEELFEDFCVVTESVRQGIPVNVSVKQSEPAALSR